ncbi:3'-5' exoribonuclease HELZ2-like [Polymixia lowei]
MSTKGTVGPKWTEFLSAHDLKSVCSKCSVKQNEITYTVKPVSHLCARDLLISKAKGGGSWRPVSRRPTFPNPSRYEVCFYFKEGSGCTKHRNRCTFARSSEEAAVWNFQKCKGLDNVTFLNLVALNEKGSAQQNAAQMDKIRSLDDLFMIFDLKSVCSLCSTKVKEITYTIQTYTICHQCSGDLLLAKVKGSNHWRPVSPRPSVGNFGTNVRYQVCTFFEEGSGCTKDGQTCTFARSFEEATVWNFLKDSTIDYAKLIRLVTESKSNSVQPENIAENIVREFPGEFLELCRDCFLGSPQKVTFKRWNDTCSADAAHTWEPVLVHHLSESHGKEIYSQVRPLPSDCRFEYCSHVKQGKPCWHKSTTCHGAHSDVEMAVWKAESSGMLIRPELLQLSQKRQTGPRQPTIYCKACCLTLSSQESFYKHCVSLDHARMLSEDTTTKWVGRPPPYNRRAELRLCERPRTCEYGDGCLKAHSDGELQEWLMRVEEEQEIRRNIDEQGLMSYAERLLEEYKTSINEVHIISEQVDDVSVTCDEELFVECGQTDARLQWNLHVNTERQLVHVALLKQEPGASFCFLISGETTPEPCTSSSGEPFQNTDVTYDITVSFTSTVPGLYEQWLVMDFDMRPVLLRKLKVRVGPPSSVDIEEPTGNGATSSQSLERWHRGNRVIIPCLTRTEEQEELLKEYKPPQMSFLYKPTNDNQTPLTPENYKERMHNFLYSEEQAEDRVVSRLSIRGEITTSTTLQSERFGFKQAPHGELFCAVSVPCNLTPDTPEGLVLRRSIQSGLIAPVSSEDRNCKVYEASILKDTTSEHKMHLQLSKRCCSELTLKSNDTHQMEVQFQMDRLLFCKMHKAVDLLPDTKRVLPDFKDCGVPANDTRYHELNAKQQSAIDFIVGDSDVGEDVAPLLIYGPFGTGKTFTLATAAKELTKKPENRVLICTYTNSSADLYVKDYFHSFISQGHRGIRPIRIKANKHTSLQATDQITLRYCLLSEDRQNFLPPTKADLTSKNIVIATTSMARRFHDLKLPNGYFTHILIDEASQMLECEALIPLALAGPNTRVVLAGDHMQMGPKLFSVEDHQRSDHTLLNRMFHYYQGQDGDAATKSRIIFNENYRSTKEIVEFVSTHFYVGKNDAIKAVGDIPGGPNGRSLKFHHVRGECHLDTVSMSWYNNAEVDKVVEVAQDIVQHWPSTWGPKDLSSVCVLSEGCQVRQIRTALGRRQIRQIKVENIANVQGKQFRAVIIAAVQTRESLKSVDLLGLELFNDARVLNTAMTRAKSQVVVVGDAAALCCFGKCSRIWKNYIDHCISNDSVEPSYLTKDFFERDIEEISRFHRPEHSDMQLDAILEQLKDEHEQETECSSNEDSSEFECSDQQMTYITTDVDKDLLELCKRQPNMFKQGQLVMESHNMGYVMPFDSPTRHINLKGRGSLGKSFHRDEVVVQMSSSKGISENKIIGVTKKADSARIFVCMLEDEDYCRPRHNSADKYPRRMMIPVVKNSPKICILINWKKRSFIPVWKHVQGQWTVVEEKRVDENLKQNHVFLVQVIAWKEECLFPLGRIIDILPIGTSVDSGLRILNEEFKLVLTTNDSNERFSWTDNVESQRKDLRKMLTFTVDPSGAKALDDAISLSNIGDQYEVGIHIADVASFVRPGDQLDQDAKRCGNTYHCKGKEPTHMFPPHLSTEDWSLLPCQDRKVVSLMLKVEKETHKVIGEPTFQLSLINSDRGLSYEEAEVIICERSGKEPKFDTVEDCVAVAYCFAKAHRKARLLDWAYAQTDDCRLPGKRKAHLMIEELNVLFNSSVSDVLISTQETMHCTPLRCQAAPDRDKLKELKENYGELIPLSFQARHRVAHDKQVPNGKSFRVLTKVWHDIQSAVKDTDIDKLVDLVAADDIHPQLLPLIFQYKKCLSKAYVIRSNSSPKAKIGHYSLKVKSYTQASSPIRRYIDIVLHRLLRTVICDAPVQYSQREIDILCPQFEQTAKAAKEYEQRAEMISFAVNVKKQNASKLAFIVCADQEKDSFRVSFPFDKNIFQDSLPVMYRDLQLEDQPLYDQAENCMILTWKRRIYSCRTAQIHQEVKRPQNSGLCTELPLKTWKAIVDAIDKENWKEASSLIMTADTTKQLAKQKQQMLPETGEVLQVETDSCTAEEEHYVDLEIRLKPGDTLQIQLTSEIKRAYMTPTVQLVSFNPKFEVCVDHAHSPITCFSKCANYPSRAFYNDTNEYVQVWKPMCEMESAATAVDESDGIVIEDLVVNFNRDQEHKLKGSFNLSLSWIKDWAIECNLAQCLLCIRKRGLKTSTLDSSESVDPSSFTWVAHGVTNKVDEVKRDKVKKVDFYVNHLPMETIPDCVFQRDVTFTVELIPKLLPDIRKENAIVNIVSACNLVQRIALGKHIPKDAVPCSVPRWQLMREEAPEGLPKLNKSQYDALEKALHNNFTLIQGPPGTGKTVVGVYIVYWFLELNSKSNRRFTDQKDKDKKEVILYCGPSNKSVDVVAEYLLKFGNNLKPLRVYSQQVEMLDYPYPGCGLQFSHTSRQERSKDELRSITMHHRMRQDQNPYSAEIKAFDDRIQLALEGKSKELTDEEVSHYKSLLRDARRYELERHDIVLCTCTVSSSPTLTKTISARQILIDECAMATEPQALIPLVCNRPEKIVLLGDHKQLRPIVKNERVRKLGMSKSLFERYFTIFKARTVMLDIQYRMHVNICKFPSMEYYDGLLKTEVRCRDSLLLDNNKPKTIVFGDIKGEEISLVVSTAKGNENSKANFAERDIVVNLAKKLVENGKVEPQSIVVLSPYNAQVSEIKASLQDIRGITVTTITKSQGSEWRYVIISTVRSLPSEEIEKEPDRAWMTKHVGFVGDANQINVGITRAKEGLCIIGNQELLNCSPAWKQLLSHYKANSSVTKAESIAVLRVAR